jgi:integrase/recombinase XerD
MEKVDLKRAVGRATKMGFNRSAAIDIAATNQSQLSSQVGKEAYGERFCRELFMGAPNNWEMALKAFAAGRKHYLEKKTLEGYMVLLKSFTDWLKETDLDSRIPPAQLTEGVIEEFLDYCLTVKNNSKGTANSKLVALKILYSFLVEKNLVSYNPATTVKKFKTDETPIYSFTPDQLRRIFSVIPVNTWRGARDNCIFRMIVETGCRVDEALNVSIKDITFQNNVPIRILFPETKNHKPREVSVTPRLAQAIILWLNKRKEFRINPDEVEKLHIGIELKPINMRNLQKYFLEYCQLAKIDKEGIRCSPYTLKHTFCKLFLLGGGSVNALREVVGHIDQRSIYKYTRATAKEASENHLHYAPSQVYDF